MRQEQKTEYELKSVVSGTHTLGPITVDTNVIKAREQGL